MAQGPGGLPPTRRPAKPGVKPTLPNEQNQVPGRPAGPRGKQTITGRGGKDFQIDQKLYDTIPANARARAMDTFRKQGIGGLKDQFGGEPWGGELVSAIAGARQNAPGVRPTAGPAGFAADPGTFVPGDKTGKPVPGGGVDMSQLPFGKPGVAGGGQRPMAGGIRTGFTPDSFEQTMLKKQLVAALPPQQKTGSGEVEGNPPEPPAPTSTTGQGPPLAGPAVGGVDRAASFGAPAPAGAPPVRQPGIPPQAPPQPPVPQGAIKQAWNPADPNFVGQFDQKYGAGAAQRVQQEMNDAVRALNLPPGPDPQGRKQQAIYNILVKNGVINPGGSPPPGQQGAPGNPVPPNQSPPFNPWDPPSLPNDPRLPQGGGGPIANTPPIYVPPSLPQSGPAQVPPSQFPDIFGTAF